MEENKNNQVPVSGEPEQGEIQNWKGVMIGGIPGIILGAGGVLAAQAFTVEPPVPNPPVPVNGGNVNPPQPEEGEIPVAHSVNDDMSFGEAFAAARSEVGPGGAFCWHGNVYSTYRSDDPEWVEMGTAGQQAHCHDIIVHVHVEPYTPEPDVVVINEVVPADDTDTHITEITVDPDPEMECVYGPPIPDDFDDNGIDIDAEVYGGPIDDLDVSLTELI